MEKEEYMPPEESEGSVDWMLIPFSRKTEEWRIEHHEIMMEGEWTQFASNHVHKKEHGRNGIGTLFHTSGAARIAEWARIECVGGSGPLWVGLSVVLEANEEEGPFATIGG